MAKHIKLTGSDDEMGAAYGDQAGELIRQAVALYKTVFANVPAGQLADKINIHCQQIRTLTPHLARQIEATAASAKLDAKWLYMVNARSELLTLSIPECTAIAAPRHGVMAQNWDFVPQMQDLNVVLEIELENGLKVATLTEAGMVGKIGLNSAGIGVCLNMLLSKADVSGLPIHILLRWLMEANSKAEVQTRIAAAGADRVGNVLIGSHEGWGINVEYDGPQSNRTELGDEPFIHTNHLVDNAPLDSDFYRNSVSRYQQAQLGSRALNTLNTRALDRLLSDRSNEHDPVHVPHRTIDGMQFGTLYTVLMDLAERTFFVRKGQEISQAYEAFHL